MHLSPPRSELEASGTIEAIQSLRAEGKVRFVGMSGTLPNLPDHIEMGVFDVFQIRGCLQAAPLAPTWP